EVRLALPPQGKGIGAVQAKSGRGDSRPRVLRRHQRYHDLVSRRQGQSKTAPQVTGDDGAPGRRRRTAGNRDGNDGVLPGQSGVHRGGGAVRTDRGEVVGDDDGRNGESSFAVRGSYRLVSDLDLGARKGCAGRLVRDLAANVDAVDVGLSAASHQGEHRARGDE